MSDPRARLVEGTALKGLTVCDSQSVIVGCYVIIFGAGEFKQPAPIRRTKTDKSSVIATLLLEFQIPPAISRWAPFLFSFIGRGICACTAQPVVTTCSNRRRQSTSSSDPSCYTNQLFGTLRGLSLQLWGSDMSFWSIYPRSSRRRT